LCCVASGCDSGSGSSTSARADTGDLAETCAASCDQQARCETDPELVQTPEACRAECEDEAPPPELFRRVFVQSLGDCFAGLDCDTSDDSCVGVALADVDPNFATAPLGSQCLEVQNECGGFSDDLCTYAIAFTPDGQARFEDCLNLECDAVAACLQELLDR
jgi:hypothetical protein